jgi:hypothetical protein
LKVCEKFFAIKIMEGYIYEEKNENFNFGIISFMLYDITNCFC